MATEIASAYVSLIVKAEGTKQRIEGALDEVDGEGVGKKLGGKLGAGITNSQAAIAGAVGGIFAQVANMAAGALTNLFGEAVAASDATEKFAQTLGFAGLDTSAIDGAMSKARAYADETVYDLSTIQNTTAQLAANGIKNYSELTEAAGNLNAVAGGNADTFKSVAMMLTQTAGQGKLTTENWNQLSDAIPGASGRLQEALEKAGAYVGNFREAMAEGEITADEFNAALLSLGSESVAVQAAKSVSTVEGAVGNLGASITGVLADAFTTIKPAITGFTNLMAGFISNSQLFIPVITGLAAGLLVALAPAIWAAVTATWAFTTALLANPITWVVLGIATLVAGIVALAMNWDAVVAWITDVWSGFMGWITGVIDGFVGWWNGIWEGVGAWISGVWDGIVSTVQGAWNGVYNWLVSALVGYISWWNGIWQGVGNVVRDVFSGIASFISGVWNGIVGTIRSAVNALISIINGAIRGINSLSVDIPDWVPGVGGAKFGLSIPTIPMLAKGGTITRQGSVIVGENGPELLTLPRGAEVNPNISGGLDGMSITGLLEIGGDGLARIIDGRIVSASQASARVVRGRAAII